MKKIILPIIFIFLIGFSVFVYAQLIEGGEYSVSLNKGWNLVSLYASESDLDYPEETPSYIKAAYFYDRDNNEYIRLFPNVEKTKFEQWYLNHFGNLSESEFEDPELIGEYGAFINSAIWIYSTENRQITFSITDGLATLDYVNIKQGWNFLTVTPEFSGHSLNDLKGNCNILEIYAYDKKGWVNLINDMDNKNMLGENAMQMHGLVIKVSDDCKLGIVEEGPPALPAGETE